MNVCNSDLSSDEIYTYFIDNQQTFDHQSVVFGIRELNSTEIEDYCSNLSTNNSLPISNKPANFSSNYELRVYTSGCYYLDSNNKWQSVGLLVSFYLMSLFEKEMSIHFCAGRI
jgi:hypothetical protein